MTSSTIANLTFEFPEMQPRKRLRELVLHIAKASLFDETFGKTKLVKILYISDFDSFRLFGKPITGSKYIKLPNGIAPDNFDDFLAEMVTAGDARIDKRIIPGYSHSQMRVVARRDPDYSIFSARDIAHVDDVIRNFWNASSMDAVDATHWIMFKVLKPLEPMPYEAKIISNEVEITEEDIAAAQELIKKHGWDV